MNVIPSAQITVPTGAAAAEGASSSSASGSARKLNFFGWCILILGLYALNGTSLGHEILYYALVLIVIYLFANNYSRIMDVISSPTK